MVNVAILGFGVVGSGVAEVLTGTGEGIHKKADDLLALKYILDVRQFPDSPFAGCFVQDFSVIENDPEVQWCGDHRGHGGRLGLHRTGPEGGAKVW